MSDADNMNLNCVSSPRFRRQAGGWANRHGMKFFPLILFLLCGTMVLPAAPLDTVVFGDAVSEGSHGLVPVASGATVGALAQPCRFLLPILNAGSYGVNGGDLTFTMAVDPVRRNYFTLKLWGGDDNGEDQGRLYLYVPMDGVNYQVGYRHEGDYLPLSVSAWNPPLPGRFFYSTTLLPLWMTRGKTTLTLRIVATGELYGLGTGGPPAGNYQKVMARNSRNIYRAYTHVDPLADWAAGEIQGTAPVTTTRPAVGNATEETMLPGGAFHNGVSNRINNRLMADFNPSTVFTVFKPGDVAYLARAYSVAGLVSYQNPSVVAKVVSLLDAFAIDYFTTPSHAEDWGGNYGELGHAIHFLNAAGALDAATLNTVVDFGSGGSKARRLAWADMLAASRDYGRLSNRRGLTNQAFIASENIYFANRGLLILGDHRAFPEPVAQRYLKDTCGLLPWFGNDLPGNTTGLPEDGCARPYGANYRQVTTNGLTREWGYVGAGYGELAHHLIRWFRANGNSEFRDQAVKMAKARAPFRRPAMDVAGGSHYRTMEAIGLLSWRGVHECDGNFDGYVGYADVADVNEKGKGMTVAAASGDPVLIGYAKQMLADNNYFPFLTGYSDLECLEAFADYQTVKNASDSGARLPMTHGQPDFVWSDEENGILAIRVGDERLWFAPFWHAQGGSGLNGGTGINGVARFHHSAPTHDQYGTMETTPLFRASGTSVRPNFIDNPGGNFYMPPDNPSNAYAGELLPQAITPPDASNSQPFGGRADFYAFRFGRYLIGMNTHASESRALRLPVGFAGGTDLATGMSVNGSSILVAAASTVVVDTGVAVDPAPLPNTPLALVAVGSTSPSISLNWSPASGATRYSVRRSTTPGGPYLPLAAGTDLPGTNFVDTEVEAGAAYSYIVTAENAFGTSYDSMEATASAGVPPPWITADIGAVGTAGSASYSQGAFSITGYGSDLGGNADSCHFLHLPITGNGTITARLSGLYDQTGATKVGLMMRQNLNAGSPYVLTRVIGTSLKMAWRTNTNGNTSLGGENLTGLPQWYRLTRTGNTFTASWSSDGTQWITAGESPVVALGDSILVGLAICSRNLSVPSRVVFDGVVVSGIWENAPAQPSGLTVVPGSQSAGLSWLPSIGANTYRIKRSISSGGPYIIAGSTGATAFSDVDLINGTVYYYVVSALNSVGESSDSSEVSVTPAPQPPATPAGLAATIGNGIVQLTWNEAFGASGYQVKRASSPAGPFISLTTSPILQSNFTDLAVENGITYHYVVTAIGEGGESAPTPSIAVTPSAVASVPGGLVAIAGNLSVSLAWAPTPGATSYTIYRSTGTDGPYTVVATGLTSNGVILGGLENGTMVFHKITAVNAAGESAASLPVAALPTTEVPPAPWSSLDIGAPAIPGGLSHSDGNFSIRGGGEDIWGNSDQFHFVHQRAAGASEIRARVGSLTNTDPWAKAGLMIRASVAADAAYAFIAVTPTTANGVRFQYRTSTGGAAAEQSFSAGNGRNPPEWVRLVLSGGTVTAFRSNSSSTPSNWTSLGSINIPELAGAHELGLAVTSHHAGLVATANFTNVSTVLSIPPAPSDPVVSTAAGRATISWSAVPGATGYSVLRSQPGGGPRQLISADLTETSFTDSRLPSGSSFHYVVRAVNSVGAGPDSREVVAIVPSVPDGLTASPNGGGIFLSWNAFPGASAYLINRSTAPGGPRITIASGITTTNWLDDTTTPGQSYFYTVSAVLSDLASTFESAEVHAARGLPLPWISQAVGGVALPGSGTRAGGVFSIAGSGSDIGSTTDNFHFVGIPLDGDGAITARFVSQTGSNTVGKSGLMMRESLAGNSKAVMAIRQLNATARFATRASTGGSMSYVNAQPDPTGIDLPRWFRLERLGNTFTASLSTDGLVWTSYATSTVVMDRKIHVGFCAVSRDANNLLSASFDEVEVTGWLAPPEPPSPVTAFGIESGIQLTWSPVLGATGYHVRRASSDGGPYSLIASTVGETLFTDLGLAPGTTRHYVVSSLGLGGESIDSSQASATSLDAEQAWRLLYFGTIENAGLAAGFADPDGDGWENAQEYLSGTNPTDPHSALRVTILEVSPSEVTLGFPSEIGRIYRVRGSSSAATETWFALTENIPGTGSAIQVTIPRGSLESRRFYQVEVWREP